MPPWVSTWTRMFVRQMDFPESVVATDECWTAEASTRVMAPVPTTSIWSPTDGVVAWRCSVETRQIYAENIVVESSHLGLGAHPAALYAIADRLAQPEGHWEPFHREGWRQYAYRDPEPYRHHRERKTEEHAHRIAHASPAQ